MEKSRNVTDGLRERKERGNENRFSRSALAKECVISHYPHAVQNAGQSGDNKCFVWYLDFLFSLPAWLIRSFSCFVSPPHCGVLSQCIAHLAFGGFNYQAISSPLCVAGWRTVATSSLSVSLLIIWTQPPPEANVLLLWSPISPGLLKLKEKSCFIWPFAFVPAVHTWFDELIEFRAHQPVLREEGRH